MQHFEIIYGYRPSDPVIFLLNAWEFIMWWMVWPKKLAHAYAETHFLVEFPDVAVELKANFILLRRTRPMVPSPRYTPMPDRVHLYPESPGREYEEKCRLHSLYMRPWTLNRDFATSHVPYITDLQRVPLLVCWGPNVIPLMPSSRPQRPPLGVPTTVSPIRLDWWSLGVPMLPH